MKIGDLLKRKPVPPLREYLHWDRETGNMLRVKEKTQSNGVVVMQTVFRRRARWTEAEGYSGVMDGYGTGWHSKVGATVSERIALAKGAAQAEAEIKQNEQLNLL
ncbi:MAG: hypothetical protein LBK99_24190 [Opitutaceae bacterium]|jgi:hypothetical protein|nr:hypothetical protein [Opitutaceae bacterium]